MEEYLMHEGVGHDENPPGRGSGRYPFGSGNRPHQHAWDLKARYEKYKAMGMSPKEIAAAMGYTKKEWDNVQKQWVEGGNTAKLKAEKEIAVAEVNSDKYEEVMWYYNHIDPKTGKPYKRAEIARIMGINESSVRSIENTKSAAEDNQLFRASEQLKKISEEKGFIDVGKGAELSLGVSPDRMQTVLEVLKKDGYSVENIYIPQASNPNRDVTMKVLCPPGMEGQAFKHRFDVKSIEDISGIDNVATLQGWQEPVPVKLDRIKILYDEQGGSTKDGMIEIRPGVEDLSLGNARYGQVRIAVDCGNEGIRYIKGMAVYNPDLPEGKDILVNSNKSIEDGVKKALKDYEAGSPNPFGATVVQTYIKDKEGNPVIDSKTGKPKLSSIQFVGTPTDDNHDMHVEGSWGDWSRNLPAQFLAKQSLPLVKQQLKLKTLDYESQYKDILSMENVTVKKKLLIDFADACDGAATDLKAAPLPGQGVHVILQSSTLKDNEVYAPNYPNGTQVALVRFPHTGPFEIPVGIVNNNDKESIKQIGKNAKDAICVSKSAANKLSGADFDGDTCIVIPMTRKNENGEFDKIVNIKSMDALPGLKDFNTEEYGQKRYPGVKYHKMTAKEKGIEMGVVSNMITDMYAKGCEDYGHLERAVKYSMIVIDAEKHKLNYKQAYEDLNIEQLKDIYQHNADGSHGASSLISRSKSTIDVPIRSERYLIDPETGEKQYLSPRKTEKMERKRVKVEAPVKDYRYFDANGRAHKSKYLKDENGKDIYATVGGKIKQDENGYYYYDKGTGKDAKEVWVNTGNIKPIMQKIPKMEYYKDARSLLSENPNEIEKTYADYANHMKAMANQARKEYARLQREEKQRIDPEARKRYSEEVASLEKKLTEANKNAPRERMAQLVTNSRINAALAEEPERYSSAEERKKLRGTILKQARIDCGAQKTRVTFTDKEWEAIQNHAIGETKLLKLLDNADSEEYTAKALPRESRISDSKKSLVVAYYKAGYTYEQIAAMTGVAQGSISSIVK